MNSSSTEVNAIFGTSPIEGATMKEKTVYVNEARRDKYPAILTSSPSSLDRPIFSEIDAYAMHFPHNGALVITMHIDYCRVLKILVDGGAVSTSCTNMP